jgi:hypothetical protein
MKTVSKLIRYFLVGVFGITLGACSSVSVEDYAGRKPRIVAEEFFNGELLAHGVVKDRSGKVTRYFEATIDASWRDGIGTLDERFVFDDGEQQTRVWTLKPSGDNTYQASAGDVIGIGGMTVAGNSVFLDYVLRVPYDGDTIDLRIDDRMYLVSERVLLNESIMTKWGFKVGSLMLVIEKL